MIRTESVLDFCEWLQAQQFDTFIDRRTTYFRIGCGLDIETTNVIKRHRDSKQKFIYDHVAAYAYAFMITIGDHSLLCRRWDEILTVLKIMQRYGRKNKGTFFCWIANCSFEFQFFRSRIKIRSAFAKKSRQPLYFNTDRIHYADALAITGGSLQHLSKTYTQTQKKVGDLDYSIPRSWRSPLSDTEKEYCYSDTEILSEFSDYIFTHYPDQGQQIPYTQTGIIRAEVRAGAEAAKGAKEFVRSAYPPSRMEYDAIMHYLFRGGLTHACAILANIEHTDVYGYDLTSSYPAVMLQEYYPMSVFMPITLQHDGKYITDPVLHSHCCMFVADFYDIEAITMHTIESKHKIIEATDAIYDNGRLIKAKHIRVHLTELDYDNYTKFYTWDRIEIGSAKAAARGKLPKYLREPLLRWYVRKQQLKAWCKRNGIRSDDLPEYRIAKAMVNSFYGLCVQRLRFISPIYDIKRGIWAETIKDKPYAAAIKNAVLLPQWGIWVTAHARHRIADMIHRIDPDKYHSSVIYYDTDSIYTIGDCSELIAAYNSEISVHNKDLPPECDDLGLFDKIGKSGHFKRFKTIGAKRYIKETDDGEIIATVAGLNGEAYVRKYGSRAFDAFSLDGFLIAAGEAEKLTSIYIDAPTEDVIDGTLMRERTCVALAEIDFGLSVDPLKMYAHIIEMMMNRLEV